MFYFSNLYGVCTKKNFSKKGFYFILIFGDTCFVQIPTLKLFSIDLTELYHKYKMNYLGHIRSAF